MNRPLVLLLVAAGAAAAQTAPSESLYVLPMRAGLDQFLANHLAAAKLYRVATDPKLATVFLTDRLGEAFERKMNELFPPAESSEQKDDREARADKEHTFAPAVFASGAAKGNVFLVDAKSREVIWSGYVKPKNNTSNELNKTARLIVERMTRDRQGR